MATVRHDELRTINLHTDVVDKDGNVQLRAQANDILINTDLVFNKPAQTNAVQRLRFFDNDFKEITYRFNNKVMKDKKLH